MINNYKIRFGSLIFTVFLIIGLVIVSQKQFSNGLEYDEVEIKENNLEIKGLITYPSSYRSSELYPSVIIFHGFSSNKEMMRPFSEEFANQGFIALTVDALGHGESSSGILGKEAIKNTGLISLRYLLQRNDVDLSRIGLVGHSMGGSILTQITSVSDIPIASVVIGNSLNSDQDNPFILNQTSPANLLVAMGTYDEIFTIEDTKKNIANSLGLNSISIDVEYGNFSERTARKVITPKSDHLFEVLHPSIIENTVSWISKAVNQPLNDLNGMIHLQHQLFTVLVALLVFVVVILIILILPKGKPIENRKSLSLKYHSLVSILGFLLGSPFSYLFSSIFTGSFTAWFIISGSIYIYKSSKYTGEQFGDRVRSTLDLSRKDIILGIGIFGIIFLPIQLMFLFLPWDLRFVIPLFSYVNFKRFTQIMIPIMLAGVFFFLAEHQVLIDKLKNPLKSSLKVYFARSWTFILILILYYVPIFLLGLPLSPTIGFLSLFIVGFIPIIFFITFITEYARFQNLHPVVPSIIVSGIIAWVLASTLPFI